MSTTKSIDAVRASITAITKILSENDIKVTQMGTRAFVESNRRGEPIRVNVPHLPDDASDELIEAVHGFLDHEVGHLLFTDFKKSNQLSHLGDTIFNIYNIIEDTRIEREMANKFRGSGENLRNVGKFFLTKSTDEIYNSAMRSGDKRAAMSALFVPAFRAYAGQKLFQDYMLDKWDVFFPAAQKIGYLVNEIAKVNSTEDSCELAVKIFNALDVKDESGEEEPQSKPSKSSSDNPPQPESNSDAPEDEEVESQSSSEEEQEDEQEEGDGYSASPSDENDEDDTEEQEEGNQPTNGGEEDEEGEQDGETGVSAEGTDDSEEGEEEELVASSGDSYGSDAETEKSDDKDDSIELVEDGDTSDGGGKENDGLIKVESDEVKSFSMQDLLEDIANSLEYDEAISKAIGEEAYESFKQSEYRVFSTDYDIIAKYEPTEFYKPEMLTTLDAESKKITGTLQKVLERLVIAKSHSRNLPGQRSGRVNSSALFKLKTGDNRVFKTKEVSKSKEVAVSLVVDCSGSMSGYKIQVAMLSAYALSSVLSRLNISNEVIGFTTADVTRAMKKEIKAELAALNEGSSSIYSRYEPIYMPILKGFDEKLGPEQKKRMAELPHNSAILNTNIDGESIMIAAKRLLQRPEAGKQMFVLSDGSPSVSGKTSEGVGSLMRATRDIEAMGVDLIGIGVCDNSVQRFYRNHVVIKDAAELPSLLLNSLKKTLLG